MPRWSLSLQHQLQCGKNCAHVTVLTLAFVGIASLLSHFKKHNITPRRFPDHHTIICPHFSNKIASTTEYSYILTVTLLESRNNLPFYQVFKISDAKWLAEKGNPLVGRQDPKRLQHTSRNRTLPKQVYRLVSHASHCSSLTFENGVRTVAITTQAKSEVMP